MADGGRATVASTVFNLSNNIVGAGILSLPWCFRQSSILEGALLICLVGSLSGLSLVLLAVCCERTQCFSFREMGERTLGRTFGVGLQAVMLVYTFFSCVSFMILAGDFFSGADGIPQGLCGTSAACDGVLPTLLRSRFGSVATLTLTVLAPLSCLRELNALRFTSLLSIVGMMYLLGLLAHELLRAAHEGLLPPREEIRWAAPRLGVFAAAPIVNVAFIAHYNVPRFYQELRERSVRKFATAVAISLGMCGTVYLLVATFGYVRFGEGTSSDVLNNFSSSSRAAVVGKLGMAAVVLFTYPLAFNAMRASAMALLDAWRPSGEERWDRAGPFLGLTAALVACTFVPGSTLSDISVVLDYKGAVLGGCIGFAFPGWMFLAGSHPESVRWCCVKPVQVRARVEEEEEEARDTPLLPESGAGEEPARWWRPVALAFFAWALVSGVMGVVVTTINIVDDAK